MKYKIDGNKFFDQGKAIKLASISSANYWLADLDCSASMDLYRSQFGTYVGLIQPDNTAEYPTSIPVSDHVQARIIPEDQALLMFMNSPQPDLSLEAAFPGIKPDLV